MSHVEGLFGWVDLSSTDTERSKDFYSGLFGWTAQDQPLPEGMSYTQFLLDGAKVAGMGPMPPDMAAAGMPSMWNSYVIVADVDAAVERAAAAGGSVVMPVMTVMDQGRMAMVADPGGAVVGMWQPAAHEGAEVFNVPGALTWNELQCWDVAKAKPFYSETFGWEWEAGPQPGYDMCMLAAKEGDDKSNGGILTMPPGVPEEMPSFWLVYFAVADCDASMQAAQDLGATVMFEAMEMGPGRFGGLVDPTGAAFAIGSFGG
ncbi:MAG: VOC family protein [Actinobacteria bacterium]|nr:VOC family protein [Actinomycetota bacterium]MCB9411771.1 VOC family protein [Actinomycetota bacterium]